MAKISAVINALNAQETIERALKSVEWADEIVVVDDGSTDKTLEIAKKYTKNIYHHKSVGFVEPARNFAISKATGDWVLILDTDEEILGSLSDRLKQIAEKIEQMDYVEIPRKNIIFGKWMRASMWWPDFNVRFFKKGSVEWGEKIHKDPQTQGMGIKLEDKEDLAIVHYHYDSISQFIIRMDRYTTIQAQELASQGDKFEWVNLIQKPMGEFLGRFFANRGFEDGLHGLALSLLQAFSFFVVYLKLWEIQKFIPKEISVEEFKEETKKSAFEINYWLNFVNLSKNPFKRFVQKIGNRLGK